MREKRYRLYCWLCGREYKAGRSDSTYCGTTCRQKWHRMPEAARDQITMRRFRGAWTVVLASLEGGAPRSKDAGPAS